MYKLQTNHGRLIPIFRQSNFLTNNNRKQTKKFGFGTAKVISEQIKYLDAVPVSCICPTRRWKRDQIMREIHKNIDQIPMPYSKSIWISSSLNPFIVFISTSHIMTHKHSPPVRQRQRLKSNRGFIKWVME